MSKLYRTTVWRRVLALVLVFIMALSILGSSGYTVFAEDLMSGASSSEGTEAVTEGDQTEEENVPEEVTFQEEAPDGTESKEDTEAIEGDGQAAPEQGADADVSGEDSEEQGEGPAEAAEPAKEAGEEDEAAKPAEPDEEGEPAKDEGKAVEGEPVEGEGEDENEPTEGEGIVETAADIVAGDTGELAPGAEGTETGESEEPAAEEPAAESLIAEILKGLEDGQAIVEDAASELIEGEELTEEVLLDEESPEELEIRMPEMHFLDYVNGISVSVDAPKGAFPKGTEMKLAEVEIEQIIDAIEAAVDVEITKIKAVDITFIYDGEEIQPELPISVKMNASGMNADSERQVLHIEEDEETEEMVATVLEDADTSKKAVEFEADQFSIYAVIEGEPKIVTVHFYDDEGSLKNTQYIKFAGDAVQDLYNPKWTLEYGTEFYDWVTSMNEEPSESKDIDAINDYIESHWDEFSSDEPLSFYAVIKKVYVVTFNRYNDAGKLVELDTIKIPVDQENKTITIPGDLGTQLGSEFLGWLAQDGTKYNEGASYTVTGHTSFYLKENGRAWLIFDSNAGGPGSGADYTPPQLIYGEGVITKKPVDPTRTGYKFLGWNTSANGDGEWWSKTDDESINRFGTAIIEDVTLYAQWEGIETKYYVVFWKQKVDTTGTDPEKDYDYFVSEEHTAFTGDTVYISDEYTQKDFEHFAYYSDISDEDGAVVKADGSTMLNVYYNRDVYHLRFFFARSYEYQAGGTTTTYRVNIGTATLGTIEGVSGNSNSTYYTTQNGNTRVYWNNNQFESESRSRYSIGTATNGTISGVTGDGNTTYYNAQTGTTRVYWRNNQFELTNSTSRENIGTATDGTITGVSGDSSKTYYTTQNGNTRVYWVDGRFRTRETYSNNNQRLYSGAVWEASFAYSGTVYEYGYRYSGDVW